MMDIFEKKNLKPMLISEMKEAFDSPDYIYELKLDGVRCIAYLDSDETELRNKRNLRVSPIYPELKNINKQVKKRCILDGELIVTNNGKPDFFEMQRRALMTNKFRIELAAKKHPVSFVAYDILYLDTKQITDFSIMERKKLLQKTVSENERLSISRYIENNGIGLYNLTVQQELEGIVAKRKDSKYYFDKNTKDWIKIKYLKDDDYVICGYISKDKGVSSIVLGQYREKQLIYKGHVTLGVSGQDFQTILKHPRVDSSPFLDTPNKGNENAVWIEPSLVGTVKFMEKTESGSLRQPVFKGLRDDKAAIECKES